jgi:glycosyltransferase involved in cell wall biosynthesis
MKILMIAPEPFLTNRGSPLNVYSKIRTLSGLGHDITLLTYPEGVNVRTLKIIRVPLMPFLRNIPIGPSIHKIVYDILLLLYGLRIILRNEFDVIHAHEIDGATIGALLKNACIITRYKPLLYYDMHSVFSEQMQNKGYKIIFLNTLSKYIEKYAYRNSDKLLMISPSFKDRLSEFNQDHKAIFVPDIPALNEETVDLELYNKLKNEIKEDTVFLYMGNIEKYQGVTLLIQAFKIVEESGGSVALLVVGDRDKDFGTLRKMIRKLKSKKVYIYSQQPLEKMPTYLKFSDIVFSPRLRGTNIPYKIYPYIRMGKPLIATNIPAHSLILENSKNVLMCEVDRIDMANKMLLLMKDDSLKERIGKGAKELFISSFSPEIYKNKLKNLYNQDRGGV